MDRVYTCEDVAARYGVSVGTVWSWIRSKKLDAINIAGAGSRVIYRISESAIRKFETEGKKRA